ncbi:MAG: cytochrome C oxidase subunit II, partial [Zunongwangia sp.]|nr:cytochrome C oxidase subunit II [Zunongwangia sp.]
SDDMVDKVERINDIRKDNGDDSYEFDYFLLCNKICGQAHYNMQMKVIVESEADYEAWLAEQSTFGESMSEE